MAAARERGRPAAGERADVLAGFFAGVAPRLFADVRASGALSGADERSAGREWEAAALHALIRGVVAEGGSADEIADLVDALHDRVLSRLEPAEMPELRAHLARRYDEYDGLARTLGKAGASRVPGAIAAACARHMLAGDAASLAETLAPLLESLAEGASAALAEADTPGLELPPIEPLRALTRRLDGAGIEWGVGASGLLASLGLVRRVNDWDVQVEAPPERLREIYAGEPHAFHGHGGCHADWKLSFEEARTEIISRFAFFVPSGTVRVRLHVSRHWRGLPIASPEGWAVAYALMGEYDEPELRARRSERSELLLAHLAASGADPAWLDPLLAEPLPEPLAARLRSLPRRG